MDMHVYIEDTLSFLNTYNIVYVLYYLNSVYIYITPLFMLIYILSFMLTHI